MPDAEGKLSEKERGKIADWVNSKGPQSACPVCKANHWTVGEHLLEAHLFRGGAMVLGGSSYPMAFVLCTNCFYVRQFLAVPLGIVAGDPPPDKAREDG